jgi:hypothetical protein
MIRFPPACWCVWEKGFGFSHVDAHVPSVSIDTANEQSLFDIMSWLLNICSVTTGEFFFFEFIIDNANEQPLFDIISWLLNFCSVTTGGKKRVSAWFHNCIWFHDCITFVVWQQGGEKKCVFFEKKCMSSAWFHNCITFVEQITQEMLTQRGESGEEREGRWHIRNTLGTHWEHITNTRERRGKSGTLTYWEHIRNTLGTH